MSLGSTGLLGPDEPRYASIGRAMATTGDLVTPKLDGEGWFEKPPLLYWTVALGTRFHLPGEWAPRLPIALMSLGFLVFYFGILAREFSHQVAIFATAILGTCAGWIAYTIPAVPDLPMAVTLGVAMLLTLYDKGPRSGWIAGVFLGLAILAKGFVPVMLFAPVWLFARGKRLGLIVSTGLVAVPWFILCTLANGKVVFTELIWKHHFQRYFSSSLEHVQPPWFYVPILILGVFPWTPLMALLARRHTFEDARVRFLGWWLVFGFVVFSASKGKLPGYLLPLIPMLAIVLAVGLGQVIHKTWWLVACALTLVILPPAAGVLPEALQTGLRRSTIPWSGTLVWIAPILAVAALVWWLARKGMVERAVLAFALSTAVGVAIAKQLIFPALDARVSVRAFWRQHSTEVANGCFDETLRNDWKKYGLNYYAEKPIPYCKDADSPSHINSTRGVLAIVPRTP